MVRSDRGYTFYLARVRAGTIAAGLFTGTIYRWCRKGIGQWIPFAVEVPTPRKDRDTHHPYQFIRLNERGTNSKYKIAVHKAIWIAAYDELIPSGHDIDHIDCNTLNNTVGNLRLLDSYTNRNIRPHRRKRQHDAQKERAVPYGSF